MVPILPTSDAAVDFLRATYRGRNDPDYRDVDIGFRVVSSRLRS